MKHIENNKNVDPIKHALYGQLNILNQQILHRFSANVAQPG